MTRRRVTIPTLATPIKIWPSTAACQTTNPAGSPKVRDTTPKR